MKYQIKTLPKSEIEISIEISPEKMREFYKKSCEKLAREVNIKGFRKGHVPLAVIEQHFDKKALLEEAQELAVKTSYFDVVIKESLNVVSRPEINTESVSEAPRPEIKAESVSEAPRPEIQPEAANEPGRTENDPSPEAPFKFTATVAVMPEVVLNNYASIKIKKLDVKVEEKDILSVLEDLKIYGTTYKDVDRKAQNKDRAELEFEGFDPKTGAPVANTKSSNHPVVLGSKTMIPGFEDQIIGMQKDEEKQFKLKFPKDYGKKEFEGREMKFAVKLQRLEEPTEPELSEEYIEKITGKKSNLEDFKREMEKKIRRQKEQEASRKQENEYIEELLKRLKTEIPGALIDEEVQFILGEMKLSIEERGLNFAKFLEVSKTNPEELEKKYRPQAEKRIKIRLALLHIVQEEKIKVDESEISAEISKIRAKCPERDKAKLEAEIKSGSRQTQIYNKIALRKLFSQVLGS